MYDIKETSMAKKTTTKADNKKSDATDRETELEMARQRLPRRSVKARS